MDRYIGLDVSAQSCSLGVVGPSGKRLKLVVVETTAEALVKLVRSIEGRRHLCMEEGTQSAWLYEVLRPHVQELVVTVPKKKTGPKSDAHDAWGLAEALRIGAIETQVFKAPGQFTGLRDAARSYGYLVKDSTRVKNRLKAVFRSRGIQGMGDEIYNPDKRAEWLEQLPSSSRRLADLLGQELDGVLKTRKSAQDWLQEEAKHHPIIRDVASAPGMGPIRSAQTVAIVVTPQRFRTKRQFWSYCGLAVVTRSSSDWERDKRGQWVRRRDVAHTAGLNRNRQPQLKAIFKGAASTIISKMPEHPLHLDYQRLIASGTKPNLAKVTIARRVAAIVLAMWKHEEVYDPAKHQRPQPKQSS
jgi:transposase